jgi:uncharacterized protein (DUF1015 family)
VAHLEPFRALRYAVAPAPDLTRLIAPPYDVIGAAERRRLAAHPLNIVHVDLPEAGDGGDPYREAAARLTRWIRAGVLARDPSDALYVAEQEFPGPDGAPRRRRGLFARLRLEPYASGVVIPHERTHDGPRADRTRLLAATGANLSPIFFLHPDPDARVAGIAGDIAATPPGAWARVGDGETVRLWRVADHRTIDDLLESLRDQWVLIADGHHRYESALAHHAERTAAGGGEGMGHVLAYLCSLEDPGLAILPIHRVVHSLPGFEPARVRQALTESFDLAPLSDSADLARAVAAEAGRPGVFGLLFGGERGGWVARWRVGAAIDAPGFEDLPVPLRRLDVVLLQRLVFERVLGLDAGRQARQENLEYVKDAGTLIERGRQASLAVLLNPTRLEQVIEVARLGLRLPQKSTFFHPKVPTGLVVDPIGDLPTSRP